MPSGRANVRSNIDDRVGCEFTRKRWGVFGSKQGRFDVTLNTILVWKVERLSIRGGYLPNAGADQS
jgi:hypothetical protein